jgi:hypothetical protein
VGAPEADALESRVRACALRVRPAICGDGAARGRLGPGAQADTRGRCTLRAGCCEHEAARGARL